MDEKTCDQVVVMGSSMAGLLAARVLSERFERVVIIERDPLPPIGEHRRGVPHGRHLHGLHPRGREILDELFPGFTEALTTDGAVGCDVLGQGMTVAAAQAMTLRRLIARHAVPDARSYFRAIAAAIDVPWDIAVGADLAFPQVPGRRPARVRLVNAYLPRLHAAAAHDDALAAALVRVIGLKDRPQTLLRPDRVLRVLRAS
jgi:hypothetical protein